MNRLLIAVLCLFTAKYRALADIVALFPPYDVDYSNDVSPGLYDDDEASFAPTCPLNHSEAVRALILLLVLEAASYLVYIFFIPGIAHRHLLKTSVYHEQVNLEPLHS